MAKSQGLSNAEFSNREQSIQVAKSHIQKVVRNYRIQLSSRYKPLSYAKFASALNNVAISFGGKVSYQTIKNWEDGVYCPDQSFVLQLASHTSEDSWQYSFALDLLAVQWPQLYEPASEIGENILRNI